MTSRSVSIQRNTCNQPSLEDWPSCHLIGSTRCCSDTVLVASTVTWSRSRRKVSTVGSRLLAWGPTACQGTPGHAVTTARQSDVRSPAAGEAAVRSSDSSSPWRRSKVLKRNDYDGMSSIDFCHATIESGALVAPCTHVAKASLSPASVVKPIMKPS